MSFERQPSKNTLARRTFVAMVAAGAALTSCSVEPALQQSDTIVCFDASLEPNPDGSTTVHTTWMTNAYGPGVKEMRFMYTQGHGDEPLETVPPTTEPQTFTIPHNATVKVDLIGNDNTIASCPHADTP